MVVWVGVVGLSLCVCMHASVRVCTSMPVCVFFVSVHMCVCERLCVCLCAWVRARGLCAACAYGPEQRTHS
jgi:hypothetical protein